MSKLQDEEGGGEGSFDAKGVKNSRDYDDILSNFSFIFPTKTLRVHA